MSVEKVVDNFLNIEFDSNYFQILQLLHRKIINSRDRSYNPAIKNYLQRALFCLRESEQILNIFSEFLHKNFWHGEFCEQIISIFSVIELTDNFSRENLLETKYIEFIREFRKIICQFLLQRYPHLDKKYQWLQLLVSQTVKFESLI